MQAAKEAQQRASESNTKNMSEKKKSENENGVIATNQEPLIANNQIDFDNDQFDKQCRNIIENIKERFIDLAPLMIDDE